MEFIPKYKYVNSSMHVLTIRGGSKHE